MSLIKDIHQNLHFPERSRLVCQIIQYKSENENFLKYITILSTRPENNRIIMFRDFFSDMCKCRKVNDSPELWFRFAAADNDIFFQNR